MPNARRQPPQPLDAAGLEAAALAYLARFAASTGDLRRVLLRRVRRAAPADGGEQAAAQRAAGAALVEALIARLAASGLLDDARYAEAKAASLVRRGASRRAISGTLARHGLARGEVSAALGSLADNPETSEIAAACAFARRRRLGPYRAAGRPENRLKEMAALARAGFSREIARRVLDCADGAAAEALAAEAPP